LPLLQIVGTVVGMASVRAFGLVAVVVAALVLAACGADAPTREEVTRQARATSVRQASASAAAQLDALLSAATPRTARLKAVATSTTDICHAGMTNGFYGHDAFRLTCRRDETKYLAADGDLVDALRELDTGLKRAGSSPIVGATVQDVARYYAANGKNEDGLPLPKPKLSYTIPRQGWTPLYAEWSRSSDPRHSQTDAGMGWPVVLNERHPVDLDALWNGPLRGRRYLISVSSSVTYYEIPWPA
jgi:hypothetical protein